MKINLRCLGDVIVKCWNCAEAATALAVTNKFPQLGEENLTFLFSGELRDAITKASDAGEFDRAFLKDIKRSVPSITINHVQQFAGLRARVNFHNRSHEGGLSASDLGIVITRPCVQVINGDRIRISRHNSRALLAQAKLGRYGPKRGGLLSWGRLTPSQSKLIPNHQGYYALLLYRLVESVLYPFSWQLCSATDVHEIEGWLQSGEFPSEVTSANVLQRLVAGTIGTNCPSVVDWLIDPLLSRPGAVEIRVFWPESKGPSAATVQIGRKQAVTHVAK